MADPLSSLVGPQPITDLAQSAPYPKMYEIASPQIQNKTRLPPGIDRPDSVGMTKEKAEQWYEGLNKQIPEISRLTTDQAALTDAMARILGGTAHLDGGETESYFDGAFGKGASDALRKLMTGDPKGKISFIESQDSIANALNKSLSEKDVADFRKKFGDVALGGLEQLKENERRRAEEYRKSAKRMQDEDANKEYPDELDRDKEGDVGDDR
jgi:hypothetical protein